MVSSNNHSEMISFQNRIRRLEEELFDRDNQVTDVTSQVFAWLILKKLKKQLIASINQAKMKESDEKSRSMKEREELLKQNDKVTALCKPLHKANFYNY